MKVSIIIPVYNKIRYLATILQQVKAQSFTDFECLIICEIASYFHQAKIHYDNL